MFSGNLASPKRKPTRMFLPYKAISWGCCLCVRFQIGMWPDSEPWLCTTNTNTHKQRLVLHSTAGSPGFILGAPVLRRQAPSVAIIVREVGGGDAQAQRAHCAKVRMTDCCATHTSAALGKPPWGGAVLNWALRCV